MRRHKNLRGIAQRPRSMEPLEARRVLAAQLIGHWLADDLSSELGDQEVVAEWRDSIQNVAAVASEGTPTLLVNEIGGRSVVRFDVADGADLLRVAPSNNPMNGAGDFTVTVAFRTRAELSGRNEEWYHNTGLVDASNLGFTQDWGISLNSSGQASVGLGGGFGRPSTSLYSSVDGLNDGVLRIVSFTRRGGNMSLYVDDENPVSDLGSDAARAVLPMAFGGLLSGDHYFTGDLAEIRIYDGELNGTEISSLHSAITSYFSNQPPQGNDDLFTVDEDNSLTISPASGVLANDFDADGDALHATLAVAPQHGEIIFQPDGSFMYTPHENFFGEDSFFYVAIDFRAAEVATHVTIRVLPVHDLPTTVGESYKTEPTVRLSVPSNNGVLANDSSVEDVVLTAELTKNVEQGELTLNSDGSFDFDPQGLSGVVAFEYRINDGIDVSGPQEVTIVVNSRPRPSIDSFQTDEDTALEIDALMGLLSNDRDADGDTLTAVLGTDAEGELFLEANGAFRYVPPQDFYGLDLFSYSASDGIDVSTDVLVQIIVNPVNDSPDTNPDRFFTLPNQGLSVDEATGVLANDGDVDGDAISVELVRAPEHGRLTLHPNGSFQYEPNADFEGDDSFIYRAIDPFGLTSESETTIRVTSQPVIISEFLSANANQLVTRVRGDSTERFRDQPEISPDWIELYNILPTPIDVGGMHLTDDRQLPTKWQIPLGTTVPANGFLVVFASGEDISEPDRDELGFLHTNFQLASGGEYLALTNDLGQSIHAYEDGFPAQQFNISYGVSIGDLLQVGFFSEPSPGSANSPPLAGSVRDTRFSVDRGFFEEPFQLEISSATPDVTIRFTTDGGEPTLDYGSTYDEPLLIDRSTIVRAKAFKSGLLPTNTDTHSYFFLDDVLDQSATPPDGFPTTWGGTFTDWGMDQDPSDLAEIAGDAALSLNEARAVIKDSLKSLPTMSLVSSIDNFFGEQNGIYANTEARGVRWEKPTSVEYFDPQGGQPDFQIDAGIRMQGFTSRNPSRNPKHSLRLLFRGQYGAPQLEYPLFGDDAATSFDTIILRSNAQDAWVYDTIDNRQGQFIRDQWARETQLAMGQPGAHGTWVHLYINGLYWGVYNPTERPDGAFSAAYLGGEKADYDIVKNHEEFINGNGDAYRELLAGIQNDPRRFDAGYRDLSNDADYQKLQGNHPDGTRNPEYNVLIDVPNLIDYIIHGAYAAANDWPGNYYMGRDRTDNSTGFKFFMWDNEHGMKPAVTVNRTIPHRRDADSPTKFYHALRSNAEFRLLFADHLHRAFFNGGSLYVDPENQDWDPVHPERNVPAARWVEITSQIESALIAEATRWGDVRRTQYTPHDQFQSLRDRLLRTWFPRRSEIVLGQFQRLGLYPDHAAPVFNQHGGQVTDGFRLEISNPNDEGQIFYTLDGKDPRESDLVYSQPVAITGHVSVKARVLLNGAWSALNEASFDDARPADSSNFRISELNYNPAEPTDLEIAAGFTDNDDFEFIEFVNTSNDTIDLRDVRLVKTLIAGAEEGVSFDFASGAVDRLAPQEIVIVVEDLSAFELRYGDRLPVAGQWSGRLNNGGETITLTAGETILEQFTYSDEWYGETDGNGRTLEIADFSASLDLNESTNWRASSSPNGSPGRIPPSRVPGDSNHDGTFDSADLVLVFQAGEFEDAIDSNSTFEEGDWNDDGDFTTADLVFVFQFAAFVGEAGIKVSG